MTYKPIENYGVIGDLRTAALVGLDGSIDWLCLPNFDSPSVFAAILDSEKGGYFRIAPEVRGVTNKQLYWPDTNVLITRFLSTGGVAELADFMPVDAFAERTGEHQLVRQVTVVRGAMKFRMECLPAFDYARASHEVKVCEGEGVSFHSKDQSLGLVTTIPVTIGPRGEAVAEFKLNEGQTATFLLEQLPPGCGCGRLLSNHDANHLLEDTVAYWRRWISNCTYSGRWREMVRRSALLLKLLTFQPTGAIVAAPTCGLPEKIGGGRNWDYRYTWIRDAAFTLYSFMRIGFTQEAARFMSWLEARSHELEPGGSLQIMYGIDGRRLDKEETLDHLEGYRGSQPVRIGNAACDQLQLDIYGELMDAIYLFNKYGAPISYDLWKDVTKFLDWVAANWGRKDCGIWEVRAGHQHFVYSKLMCWVAMDRGLRLAEKRSFPGDRSRWNQVRDEIYVDILKNGWSDEMQSFAQYYGSTSLDASVLMMPLVLFISPVDPMMLKTIDAINRSPVEGGLAAGSLVYRYHTKDGVDGLAGNEGTFNMCTFWLVEALTRAGRFERSRLEQARQIFERMLGYANHVGLFGEQTGARGEALGNFPQAFTHLALISAAFNLDRALDHTGSGPNIGQSEY